MNSSRVRQNHLTVYYLTHYYVKKVSLLPASDLQPLKAAAKFLNHYELAAPLLPAHRFHGTKLHFKQKKNKDMNSSRVHQNHLTVYCLTHYYVKKVSLLPDSDFHPSNLRRF